MSRNNYFFNLIESKYSYFLKDTILNIKNSNKVELFYISMFPYPSGNLHMGHFRNYLINDILCRYTNLLGEYKSVMYFGWDAFGLPAENASIISNVSPFIWTSRNILNMRSQLKYFNFLIDWQYELNTSFYSFYKWSQFFFGFLFKKGYIYRRKYIVNWDPKDKTVLADEQVINGKGWRSGVKIKRKLLDSYFINIKSIIPDLLNRTFSLNWPSNVLRSQINWIGKSKYFYCFFYFKKKKIPVYFSNPFDLFTDFFLYTSYDYYIYFFNITSYSNLNCKTVNVSFVFPLLGVFIKKLIFLSSSLVPFEGFFLKPSFSFEKKYFSSFFNLNCFFYYIKKYLVSLGKLFVCNRYKIRDWCISRQRYWGTPIPIKYCFYCSREYFNYCSSFLPIYSFSFNYKNFLCDDSFRISLCDFCNLLSFNSTETLDTFFDSSWYFLFFILKGRITISSIINNLNTINIYIGGKEHSILHLLYVRIFFSILNRIGILNILEPFNNLITQGLFLVKSNGLKYVKMSKSSGISVDPVDLVFRYGCDCLRLYTVFCSPIGSDFLWNTNQISGCYRFINKLWRYFFIKISNLNYSCFCYLDFYENTFNIIKNFYSNNSYNNVISLLMEFFNILKTSNSKIPSKYLYTYYYKIIYFLNPICPCFTTIIWHISGNEKKYGKLYNFVFPTLLLHFVVNKVIFQINGRKKDVFLKKKPISHYKNKFIIKYGLFNSVKYILYKKNKVLNFIVSF